jgi:tetratricopeptide (TPR) repeat protein
MFSINIYLRFALIALLLGGGTVLAFIINFWYAFPLILIGLVLLVGYLLLGTIQSAAQIMQAQDFPAVEKRLNLTLTPKLLYSTNKAYYYMMKGSIAQFNGENDKAEALLKQAESIKVPTDNERAMIQLQLANLAAQKGKWNQAKLYFRNTKQYKISDANIKEQLNQFEKALQNRGQMKAAQQSGRRGSQMRPGGKRRRPKIR